MKQKKIPLRKCLVCNKQFPKKEMIRIVKDKEGNVTVDETSKANGRGAYLKLSKENIELARKRKVLEREFKVDDMEAIYEKLESMLNE